MAPPPHSHLGDVMEIKWNKELPDKNYQVFLIEKQRIQIFVDNEHGRQPVPVTGWARLPVSTINQLMHTLVPCIVMLTAGDLKTKYFKMKKN